MESGNFYFLLKTENVQPLVSVLDELSHQLQANHELLAKVTAQADALTFPDLVAPPPPSSPKPEADSANSGLNYLLNQKYKLDEIVARNTKTYSDDATVDRLHKEIEALAAIYEGKRKRNQQMVKIIHEYEELIMETILPALRKDVLATDSDIDHRLVESKFAMVDAVYRRYVANVECLSRLIDVGRRLMAVLETYDDTHYQLLNQFEVLQNLKHNLVEIAMP
ncbi:hypothetical protein DIURU_004320 [Diutina rugosa]|uniref:Uncharacterized protein n=1 Tax=Diutina rugosa TaxID=5481 RepID=A0A642UHW0_DIURU|nr:uncharacterized protein DIURU_004320 [Diutina rugosa]KAA8899298.1 hypothetical protein DIURU_004320 [Diutina rugosa]